MRQTLAGIAIFLAVAIPCAAQLPQTQQQYWQQVDEQMRQQERERWAQEVTDRAREWEQQHAWNQQQEQEEGRQSQASPPEDSMGLLLRQSAAMAGASLDLMRNPKFVKVRDGFWEYHSLGDQFRSAMFINSKGMISLHGPGGSYRGALLMLWGPNIPIPAKISKVLVTLKQGREVQTLQAFNYGFPGVEGWGTLIFAVPSERALVDSIEDVQNFEASIADQVVFSSAWHHGKEAAARL